MIKLTFIYGHPDDPESFEKYYAETHLPLVAEAKRITKSEFSKFLSDSDDSKAKYYNMAELYFNGSEQMQRTIEPHVGQVITTDVSNFGSWGVSVLSGTVEN